MTSVSLQTLADSLQARLADMITALRIANGEISIDVQPDRITEACLVLRDEAEFSFKQLSDVCGVDYSAYGKADWETKETTTTGFSRGVCKDVFQKQDPGETHELAVVYHLLSLKHNRRLRIRCMLKNHPPMIRSVVNIWASANWYEREAFDLYGILFEGHPDLRRILSDYGFIGHPFRKDFPLVGNVEMRYDPEKQRVIYQPVTITNRVLVPKVIREDNRSYVDESEPSQPEN